MGWTLNKTTEVDLVMSERNFSSLKGSCFGRKTYFLAFASIKNHELAIWNADSFREQHPACGNE